jgi:hypothetical protein
MASGKRYNTRKMSVIEKKIEDKNEELKAN